MPFDVTPITTPDIERLQLGKARIRRGWCQHLLIHGDAFCVMGAVTYDAERAGCFDDSPDVRAAINYLQRIVGHENIAHWNNAPERTRADVLALFDAAIEERVADHLMLLPPP